MKRLFAMVMAAAITLSLASVSVFAAGTTVNMPFTGTPVAVNEDGESYGTKVSISAGKVSADYIKPGKKIYIPLPLDTETVTFPGGVVSFSDVYNADKFTFKLDRDKNSKYLDEVKFVSKKFGAAATRAPYMEIVLKNAGLVEDVKLSFDVFFRARSDGASTGGGTWVAGDSVNTRFELWINNDRTSGDNATIETGEGIVIDPVSNDENMITWAGEYEVASLKFTADSDAKKFYTKLSTRNIGDIYAAYGDPNDADLYFRDFGGKVNISSTSRAELTLYNPWSEDNSDYYDRYRVDPLDAYIYLLDEDGELLDVTDQFTYVDGDETEAGVDGWQTRVRTLGTYVISDTELIMDDSAMDAPTLVPPPVVAPPTGSPVPLPPTGSSDWASLAMLFMAVSCGTVFAARKRK